MSSRTETKNLRTSELFHLKGFFLESCLFWSDKRRENKIKIGDYKTWITKYWGPGNFRATGISLVRPARKKQSSILQASLNHSRKQGATTLSITTVSITTFSIMKLSIRGLFVILNISDSQYNNARLFC